MGEWPKGVAKVTPRNDQQAWQPWPYNHPHLPQRESRKLRKKRIELLHMDEESSESRADIPSLAISESNASSKFKDLEDNNAQFYLDDL